ncbi:hypothetical protein [Acidianus bottle-shaped virus]|uniref:Uncharacterized protein ORF107a n=1 Tax=Acidianus bottle-shaped virus (isolate Italy/Pozzuoli) TaxID=654911 RepID=Y107A_ABVP|nr:hypothetical protein ABV_gp55 [Acidianus bottle-shaped virus]A4ZUE1.1 RecName: Full=Uncharacterized protein ORF107a [Acidianus bottle-shaped virus (isolate Pozzuoli)]ABP73445.1 hypothetical protein [Acidianus bottle-shaped virus]
MIEENVKKFNQIIDDLLERSKNTYVYDPDIYKDIRNAQIFLVKFAQSDINPECIDILHKAFQTLSDAYYVVRWYVKQDKRHVVRVLKEKFNTAKDLVSGINSEICGE